ncbi:MAG TPA: polymer-forming cytoskeletal protein [Longimicrobiaceae bacterium]|nr:polymer-forming cytoskeletal protein [Longimicrobiaceae bacterium]
MTPPRPLLLVALLLFAAALPLRAQEVRLEGGADSRAARMVREILEAGSYLRIDRDTVLPASFRTPGDLVVVDADVRLEGTVEGRVAVLGGVLFVRPGGRVVGPIANLGGEVYPSTLASVGEVVEAEPDLRVGVAFDTAGVRVRVASPDEGPRLALPGIVGLRLPTYDRVNGLTLAAGPAFLLTGDPAGARVDAWVSYYTARSDFGGGAAARAPLGRGLRLEARAERSVFTSEAWSRGDLANTAGSLVLANDYRDYWESDRVTLSLERVHEEPLIAGEFAVEPRLALMAMRDRSLENRDPWALLDDFDRPNPPVDEVEWTSAVVGAGFRWLGRSTAFAGAAAVEQAIPAADDVDLTQWTVDGLWTMQALYRHTVGVRFRGMGTLGGDPAPRQRRTFLGGTPTLRTFEVASFRGDRLAYVESTYGIPLPPRWTLPLLGPPTLQLTHVAGMAWLSGTPMPAWEQNLGAGIAYSVARVEVFVNPAADGLDPTLNWGVMLPAF